LCMFAGLGIVLVSRRLVEAIAERRKRPAHRATLAVALAGVGAICIAPGFLETKRSHPHGLSYYTPIVGGPWGGASLGLNRGFWGYETGAIVDWLNVHLPNGGRVYPNDTFHSSFEQLRLDGRLHTNIESEFWTPANCDVAVV